MSVADVWCKSTELIAAFWLWRFIIHCAKMEFWDFKKLECMSALQLFKYIITQSLLYKLLKYIEFMWVCFPSVCMCVRELCDCVRACVCMHLFLGD